MRNVFLSIVAVIFSFSFYLIAQLSPAPAGALTLASIVAALGFTPLSPANNLSELTAATARTNLGLGTAATQASSTFAAATLKGTTASIGGGALLAGACATGTVSITGATTAMTAAASPAGGVDPTNGAVLGVAIDARVSSANTVTVAICAPIAGTPAAATYAVTVFP